MVSFVYPSRKKRGVKAFVSFDEESEIHALPGKLFFFFARAKHFSRFILVRIKKRLRVFALSRSPHHSSLTL